MNRFNIVSIAAIAALAAGSSAFADSAAHGSWRTAVTQNRPTDEGCFHVSYPNLIWEKEDCRVGQPRVQPVLPKPVTGAPSIVGNEDDWVAKAQGLITQTAGGFQVTGVKSETGVGVEGFGYAGILGPNEYSLQINTNANETTSPCDKHSGCHVWQQFVYTPDYLEQGEAEVYIQYWLIGWGSSDCPTTANWKKDGKNGDGNDCYVNSAYKQAPDLPITDLGKMSMLATADPGGNDTVSLTYENDSYTVIAKDKMLDISSVWRESEFNVVGDTGGSRADFNSGSSITVTVIVLDGSTAAPSCVSNGGTTGESNNLNLGGCNAYSGFPNIVFTESN